MRACLLLFDICRPTSVGFRTCRSSDAYFSCVRVYSNRLPMVLYPRSIQPHGCSACTVMHVVTSAYP